MSLDSDLDSSDNIVLVSVSPETPRVVPDQRPLSEPALQDQANPIPVITTTSEMPKPLDFVALSEAISQFKASRMFSKSDAGESLQTTFGVDPHQSFLSHSDLSDSYPQCSSENHSVSNTRPETPMKTESTVAARSPLSSSSPVEASRELVHYGETAAESTSSILNISKAWEQSSTSSTDTTNAGQASNESGVVSEKPAVNSASSSEAAVKHFLPRAGSFYPALQSFMASPRFISHNAAVGLRHPLLNCTVSNSLMGAPVFTGLLPNPSMQMSWSGGLAQGSAAAAGLWGAHYGVDMQQIHRSPFLQTWQGNPAFQGDAYHPNRGGFGGW